MRVSDERAGMYKEIPPVPEKVACEPRKKRGLCAACRGRSRLPWNVYALRQSHVVERKLRPRIAAERLVTLTSPRGGQRSHAPPLAAFAVRMRRKRLFCRFSFPLCKPVQDAGDTGEHWH